jgi:hypothetical protein
MEWLNLACWQVKLLTQEGIKIMEVKYWNNLGYYEMVDLDVVDVLSEKAVQGVKYCPAEGNHSGWIIPDGMELYHEEVGDPVLVVVDLEQVANYDQEWVYKHYPQQTEEYNPMWVAFKRYFKRIKDANTELVSKN